jgi:hypothetical protein
MIDLITVVFQAELPLLEIQARSISQYVNSQDINSITIVVNDTDDVADFVDPAWWGNNAERVQVIPYSRYQYTSRVNGWENQQLIKLLAASQAGSTWSMVLDAKTWFVRKLELSQLFDQLGRACTGRNGVYAEFAASQHFVETHCGVKLTEIIGPSGVPFMFHTGTVQSLVNSVKDFPDWFQTALRYPHLATEFYLYSGHVLKRYGTYNTLYNKTQHYDCVNIAHYQAGEFDQLLALAQNQSRVLTASIHRGAYPHLSQDQMQKWCSFLKDRHLIGDELLTGQRLNTISAQ